MAVSMRKVKSVHKGLDFDLTATPIVAGQEVSDKKFSNIETRFISEKSDTFDYILGGLLTIMEWMITLKQHFLA